MVNPVFLSIGHLNIEYYGLLFGIGFLIGYFIAKRLAKEFNIEEKKVEELGIYFIVSAVIGARLFEVLFYNFSYYLSNPLKILYIWERGLASHGAIIALILTAYIYGKKNKLNFYNITDLFVIPISLNAAFVRIGNFMNGELVGKITSLPWGVEFNNYLGFRHPVQLYQAGYYILIFIVLLRLRKRENIKGGTLFWSFLLLEGIFRFVTEFFKDLPKDYGFNYLGLNLAQYISIGLIIISLTFLYRIYKPQKSTF